MTAISVVLDASNIAWHAGRFEFARVVEVRDAWRQHDRDGQVCAVIDGSVDSQLVDPAPARAAKDEGWLVVAPGDADDEILRLADEFAARVVSRDNFVHAADRYPWLHDLDRIFHVYTTPKGAHFRRRSRLPDLSPEKIQEAKRRKAEKAGVPDADDDRQWRCTAPDEQRCPYSGQIVPRARVLIAKRGFFCRACQHPLDEVVTAAPAAATGPPTVSLLHGGRTQWEKEIPPEGFVVGRSGKRHPDVVDVTAGLPPDEARAISGEHLRLFPDDTGLPVAVHLRDTNASFLNPRIDAEGLPANNRMEPGVEYALWSGDELLLGPGLVRLLIQADQVTV